MILRNIRRLAGLALLLYAGPAPAVDVPSGTPDGACWGDPLIDLPVTMPSASFSGNTAGSESTFSFQTGTRYQGWCYSTRSGTRYARYFKSEIKYPPSDIYPTFFRLTDDVDYRIRLNASVNTYSPFSNLYVGAAAAAIRSVGTVVFGPWNFGNAGTIILKLRRDLVGGAFFIPAGIELTNLYQYVNQNGWGPVPIFRMVTRQIVVPVPVECEINNGTLITVPFGNLDSSLLGTSGSNTPYNLQRPLSYRCNTRLSQDIKVRLAADAAGYGDAIRTSNPNIGVVMSYKNRPVAPEGSFATKIVNGQGSDDVTFSAIKRAGATPATGAFTGSATLIIESL